MTIFLSIVFFAVCLISFSTAFNVKFQRSWGRGRSLLAEQESDVDPNFEAHLGKLLNAGLEDRPSPELATDLRKRYKQIGSTKRKAADTLRNTNKELAAELDELADELTETSEKFVSAAMYWDAWGRPDPELPHNLREEREAERRKVDPNYEAHLESMMAKGSEERPDPELPSQLRMLKYKQSAAVQRLAATQLRQTTANVELAAEMDEIADEIEESSERFAKMAEMLSASKMSENSTSNR
eukprot:gene3218-6362_t